MISNAKKAILHIARDQLGMSKAEYEKELQDQAGVSSSVDLTDRTFNKVLRRFKALGFVSTSPRRRKTKNLPKAKAATMSKIEAILLDMNLDWAYVDAIAKKRFDVDSVQWLEYLDLRAILQMMIYHQKRE